MPVTIFVALFRIPQLRFPLEMARNGARSGIQFTSFIGSCMCILTPYLSTTTLAFRPHLLFPAQRHYAIMTRAKRRAGIYDADMSENLPLKLDTAIPSKLNTAMPLEQPLSENQQAVQETSKTWSALALETPNAIIKRKAPQRASQSLLARLKLSHPTTTKPFIRELKPADMATRMVKVRSSFTQPLDPHLLKVAILGAANAGKSTLINQMIGKQASRILKEEW
ncbi:hypothetical protein BC937DRAFT_90135 [Endogone sp. FLAS-F59071]|nr:hypothetical protein BC937DRAFT_90135 [Endogone sp. FLAS-F59071]|eukprot:RUS17321.1 hypothetical protein BC937DRAFT_90135 [Endogone sp. FLAS-F59071]